MAMNDGEIGKLKINLGIDSSTFDKGIASANRKLKILETGYKQTQIGVSKFDDSIENLTKTQDYLSQKFDIQKVKANDLWKQYKKLAENGNENSKAAENMLIRYNKTTAEMRKTELALENTTKKIQEQGTEFGKTSKQIDEALTKIKQDLKVAESAYNSATESAKKLGDESKQLQVEAEHLTKVYALQEQGVTNLKQKYEMLLKTKGQDARETKDALIKYNESVATMHKTGNAIDDVNAKIKEQGSEFTQASRTIDTALTNIEQDLKVVESAYKTTAASAVKFGQEEEHLYEQSQHLARVFELQEQHANKLKEKYEQLARARGEDSTEAKQALIKYNESVATARKTVNALDDVNHKIDESKGQWRVLGQTVDEANERLQKGAERLKGIGGGMTAGLTTSITASGLAIAKMAGDVETSTARLSAQLGLSAKESKQFGEISKGVWKQGFGEDINDVSRAVQQVTQNIQGLSLNGIKQVTKDSLIMAQTWDADVNEVTRAGSNIMKGFGISSKEAFDLMAHGGQAGLNFSNEMFDNLSEYAPLFGKMGFSAEEYFQLLEKGSAAGVYNLDYINDAMKEFQIRAKDGSKGTAEAFGQMSESTQKLWKDYEAGKVTVKDLHNAVIAELKGMDDQTKANQIGVGVYGTKFEDLEADAMYALGGIDGKLSGVDGSMKKVTQTMEETFNVRAKKALRSFLDALLPLGNTILGIAERSMPALEKGAATVNNLLENMSPAAQTSAIALAGITAVAGPLLFAFGGLLSAGGGLVGLLGSLGIGAAATGTAAAGAAGGVGILGTAAAALTGPVGIGIASVAALTAGTVLLWKNYDTVKEKFAENPFLKFVAYANPVTGALLGIVDTGKKIQGMYDEVIPKANLFSDAVSQSTQKAINSYMKLDEQASTSLMTMYAKQQTITDQNMATMMGKYDSMTNQILTKLDSRYSQEYAKAQKLFADSSALSSAEEAKILQNMNTWHEEKRASVQGYEDKIKGIYKKAADEHRSINESEYLTIKGIQEQMRKTAVQTLSKSEAEQKIILGRLENASGQITARQAAKVIQNSYKQKTESVKHANSQYKETVHNIEYMRDVTGRITAEQAKELIAHAEHQRKKSIANAETMHQKVVEEAKSQAKGHGKWIDSETGKVATGWDKMWSKVSTTWDKILGIFGVKSTGKTVHKKGDNTGGYDINAGGRATGTPNGGHPGGWAITSEQGRELIHEPGKGTYLSGNSGSELRYLRPGSSVLPNNRTEQFLKKYGFDGNKIPGYESGVGDYFDAIMDGPGAVWDSVTKKVGGLTDSLLPDFFTKATGSITGRIKDAAVGKIQTLIDDWMTQFGSDGEGTTGVVGPGSGMGGMQPYVEKWYNLVKSKFGKTHFMGGYNNRNVRGGSSKSMHAFGQAFDIGGSKQTMASIAEYLRKTASNLQYVIYNRKIAGPGMGKAWRGYNGQNPHVDHVHADFYGQGGGKSGPSGKGAERWRGSILKAAAQMKEPVTAAQVNGIIAQIHRESKGDQTITQSSAVKDINMRRGQPARGLLQYIPPTFRNYSVKGHGNILSGYDQLLAFFNNKKWRSDLPYGRRGWGPTGGRKYEQGGLIDTEQIATIGEGNKREMIIPLEKHKDRARMLWTQAGEILGMFGDSSKPVMPGQNAGGGTVNNVNNTPNVTINLNYSGNTSENDVLNMVEMLKEQLKQELIYDMRSYNGRMGYK